MKFTFWLVAGCIGYLIGGGVAAAIAILICVIISGLWTLLGAMGFDRQWP